MKIPETSDSLCLMIDVQEKLCAAMPHITPVVGRIALMLSAAREMGLRTVVNEQYPRGLGNTIPDLAAIVREAGWPVLEKTSFSSFGCQEFRTELSKTPVSNLIIFGIEAHVCVQQTALDAIAKGLNVFVLADAVESRRDGDKAAAIELMRQAGARITTVESMLFMLLREATSPHFKAVSKLVR